MGISNRNLYLKPCRPTRRTVLVTTFCYTWLAVSRRISDRNLYLKPCRSLGWFFLLLFTPRVRSMAPKVKGQETHMGPSAVARGVAVPLNQLSAVDDMRAQVFERSRINELKKDFLDGNFQQSLLASLSIVENETDSSGLKLLEDGKCTVQALRDRVSFCQDETMKLRSSKHDESNCFGTWGWFAPEVVWIRICEMKRSWAQQLWASTFTLFGHESCLRVWYFPWPQTCGAKEIWPHAIVNRSSQC